MQWVWTTPGFDPSATPFLTLLGDISVNHSNGDVYYDQGFAGVPILYRLNIEGVVVDTYILDFDVDLEETFRMYYNQLDNELWVGGGGAAPALDLEKFSPDFSSRTPYTVINEGEGALDVVLLEFNPTQDTMYFLGTAGYGPGADSEPAHNALQCATVADPTTVVWFLPSGYDFLELKNNPYYGIGPNFYARRKWQWLQWDSLW